MGKFLGDKSAWTSWTSWGVMLLALGGAMVEAGGDTGMLASEGVRIGGMVLSAVGTLFAGWGVRRKLGENPQAE